jgi:cobalt/nickel transport system permease protein
MEQTTHRPEWFSTKACALPPSGYCKANAGMKNLLNRKHIVTKTLRSISQFFSEAFFSEEYSKKKGLLQSLDPRIKIASVVALIVSLTFIHSILLLIAWHGFAIMLALCSRINLRFFLTRVWIFIPLFTAFIALPALFNIFVPGEPLVILKQFHGPISLGPFQLPDQISITRQGTLSASLLILRVSTSVSFIVLLILTTKWFHLLRALSFFRIPKGFVWILTITYRYIHLLLKAMEEMHQVFLSRVLKKQSWRSNLNFTASGIYAVLKKSLQTGENVFAAMRSKGYSGKIKLLESFQLSWSDAAFILITGLWIIGSFYLTSFL